MIFGLGRNPENLKLRPAVRADAEEIWKLVLMHFPDPAENLTGTEVPVLALQLEKAVARGWVLTSGRRIVAATVIRPAECYIWMLYVRRGWQHLGLGRRLLEHALGSLRDRACGQATLRVPLGAAAEAFYRHLGWRPLHTNQTGTHVVYAIDLAPKNRPTARRKRPSVTGSSSGGNTDP